MYWNTTICFARNKPINWIFRSGRKARSRDILRGSEIEITIEISESRDLKVTVYIPMSDQQFSKVFNPSQWHMPVEKLQDEVETLSDKLETEIEEAVEREDYETADKLTDLKRKLDVLVIDTNNLTSDDVTDKKYQFAINKKEHCTRN